MMQPEAPALNFDQVAADCQAAANREALGRLADNLGLSIESLRRLAVGWSVEHQAWSFPMKDAAGRVVGIRLRLPNGRKLAVRGGKEGLFVPSGVEPGDRLLITEGPTDCASLLDLGFAAVGRPSCLGGLKHIVELIKTLQPTEVVVVADRDQAGRRGASRLGSALVAYCPVLRLISPPPGIKDARAWKWAGATAADVQAAIDAVPIQRIEVSVKKGRSPWKRKTA